MIKELQEKFTPYKNLVRGVIQAGAFTGSEVRLYEKWNIKNAIFFEPLKEYYERLKEKLPSQYKIFNIAIGNFDGKTKFNLADNGASSSVLKPKLHLVKHKHIKFKEQIEINIKKLDNISFDRNKFNFINLDVQGYELEALKGASKTLKYIDIIMSEVNFEEMYENCVLIGELDEFLANFGFRRMETIRNEFGWGDAIYSKIKRIQ